MRKLNDLQLIKLINGEIRPIPGQTHIPLALTFNKEFPIPERVNIGLGLNPLSFPFPEEIKSPWFSDYLQNNFKSKKGHIHDFVVRTLGNAITDDSIVFGHVSEQSFKSFKPFVITKYITELSDVFVSLLKPYNKNNYIQLNKTNIANYHDRREKLFGSTENEVKSVTALKILFERKLNDQLNKLNDYPNSQSLVKEQISDLNFNFQQYLSWVESVNKSVDKFIKRN